VFFIIAVGAVGLLTFMAIRWLKRRYFKNAFVTEFDEQRSEANETELSNKVQSSSNYDPPA
jgi:threonine dehydrogenase-like Zn-dependent dehydrogenase